ncbi:MAG: hypothetical protein LBE79_11715 [Tannerella sp.]|jgi:hypothetical protein|nr:hypothetical protein [Tannerella sp.]
MIVEKRAMISFTGEPYYATFLQRLGLKENQVDDQYLLVHQEGSNWSVCLDHVADAMLEMQNRGSLFSSQVLSILKFVVDKVDRNRRLPAFVRVYMCKDAVTRVVLQRFGESIGGSFANMTELSHKISDHIDEANEIFNSIRFCDPAIGSGCFLVNLVNEMIAAKSQLGILADKNGNPLFRYKVTVDMEKGLLVYDRKNLNRSKISFSDPEGQLIQETLWNEKKTIIENCIFGVDIEPFSVSIGQLRLWMDFLNHVCLEGKQVHFWPLLTFNLRCGDPLVSRYSVKEDLRSIFKRIGHSVADLKKWVADYKNAKSKGERDTLGQLISSIKQRLQTEIALDERSSKELLKWQKELTAIQTPSLFEWDDPESKRIKIKESEAQVMINKIKQKITYLQNNPIYKHAIEWRYEFPELLNESGDFTGFDFIIGNPPDTHIQIPAESPETHKHSLLNAFKRTGDVSGLYYELGYMLLKPEYFLCYIMSIDWMKSILADKMRQYLLNEINPLYIIDFDHTKQRDPTLSEQGITLVQKARNQHRTMIGRIKEDFDPQSVNLEDYIKKNSQLYITETEVIPASPAFSVLPDIEKRIKTKIEQNGILLVSWDIQMYSGIRTGCDDAFVIDGKTKDDFIRADYKNSEIIKPILPGDNIQRYKSELSNLWLICIPWHFPLLYDKSIKTASKKAEDRFCQQYPVIYKHLKKHKERLLTRNTKDIGVIFEWYAVQHFGTSKEWNDFTQPKIVWKRESIAPHFCLDYSGYAIMDSTCFITGQHLKFLLGVLNSKPGRYLLRNSPRLSNGDMHINILTLESLRIPVPNIKIESEMISFVNKRTLDAYQSDYPDLDEKIDQLVYDIYGLDTEEREYIEKCIQF